MSVRSLLALGLLAGCNPDQGFGKVEDTDGRNGAPDIRVEPDELVFDQLAIGESAVQRFTIHNDGDLDLHVSAIQVFGSSAYTLLIPDLAPTLPPGTSVDVDVAFSPVGPEDAGEVHILNDDPGNPEPIVTLDGAGELPELLISPDPMDFGAVMVGCSRTVPLRLQNTGDAPLTVSTLAQVGEGFSAALPATPLVLDPGAATEVALTFAPTDYVSYTSTLYAASDAAVSTTTADQRGRGVADDDIVEEFYQGDGPWEKADILFYVDQSRSMLNNQRTLANNFSAFAARLDSLALDWQVVVATKDNGCGNGGVLTPETPNLVETFTDGVNGRAGDYTEAGLTIATNALSEAFGGCNAGFLRDGSKTTLILVSDEPEQSYYPWDHYVNEIRAMAPTATITSIVGDVPSGCMSADPGTGYYEATVATGGAFLSICASDWSPYFDTIATMTASGTTDTFVLTSQPDPATLAVTVDDVPATDWSFDAALNAVVFASGAVPEPGAHVEVSFRLLGDCED